MGARMPAFSAFLVLLRRKQSLLSLKALSNQELLVSLSPPSSKIVSVSHMSRLRLKGIDLSNGSWAYHFGVPSLDLLDPRPGFILAMNPYGVGGSVGVK